MLFEFREAVLVFVREKAIERYLSSCLFLLASVGRLFLRKPGERAAQDELLAQVRRSCSQGARETFTGPARAADAPGRSFHPMEEANVPQSPPKAWRPFLLPLYPAELNVSVAPCDE